MELKMKELPPVMVGTAGHVDHGKTSLVKLLTGCDTDCLKEEKERGVSINLGFAPCQLSGERVVGIIDVPGHINFIRNMVAGAASVDILILVVAADDGIMPQTIEHLQILKMLTAPKVIAVLTKIDLVEAEIVELAKEEICEFLGKMGVYDVPLIPVSNITLEGIAVLRSKIEDIIDSLEVTSDKHKFRMNVQRYFSLQGFGTVVTGIPISGEIKIDDSLQLLPGGKSTSVRAIQNYKQQADHAASKICCALNLRNIEVEELKRGMSLSVPGAYHPTDSAIVTIENISEKFSLKHNHSLRFHSGTFEGGVKVSIVGKSKLHSLESGFAKIKFKAPVVLGSGDRFILREPTLSLTVGGGVILLPDRVRFKRLSEKFYSRLKRAEGFLKVNDYLAVQLTLAEFPIYSRAQIAYYSAVELFDTEQMIDQKIEDSFLLDLTSDYFLVASRIEEVRSRVIKILNIYHHSHKYSWGIDTVNLAQKLEIKKQSAGVLIKHLVKDSESLQYSHGRLALKNFKPAISDKQIKYKNAITSLISKAGFNSIARGSILNTLEIPEKEFRMITDILLEEGDIIVLGKHYISKECFDDSIVKLRQIAAEDEFIDIQKYRDVLGTGRKITVIILEKFDSLGITRRFEEGRKILTSCKDEE
jgi:selenocysteine-specific elongation factor